jgi:predicted ATPase
MSFLNSIKLSGFLSFSPDSPEISLTPLNLIIGPNGSGKSNLIEAIELLHATPTSLAAAIREGGGVREWLWKGENGSESATVEVTVIGISPIPDLRYRIAFAASGQRMEVIGEVIEQSVSRSSSGRDPSFYYLFQQGQRPALYLRVREQYQQNSPIHIMRRLMPVDSLPDESVLSQRKGEDAYPELTWLGQQFGKIQSFREWSFGRYMALRQPQPADLPADVLLADSRNLGMVLNQLEYTDRMSSFNDLLKRFLPRYERFSTRVLGGTVQFYLHESGLKAPVPASRLSDGTLRFMAILAILLSPTPPPLICIEEPELGLHPDAVGLLAEVLVDAATRTQLIVTTHSDVLVSALTEHAGSVLVCEHRGGTVLERLHPDKLAHWLKDYRLGEIWRIGQLGGNP